MRSAPQVRANAPKINRLNNFATKKNKVVEMFLRPKPPATFAIQIPMQSTVSPRRAASYSPYLSAGTPPRSPRQPKERHPNADDYTFLFLILVVPSWDQVRDGQRHLQEINARIEEMRLEQKGGTFLYLTVLCYGAEVDWVFISQMPFQWEHLERRDLELLPGCALRDAVGEALDHAVDLLESNRNRARVRSRIELWEAAQDTSSTYFVDDELKRLHRLAQSYPTFDGLLLPEGSSLAPLFFSK